ncbi:hypothetical protein QUC31_001953 [Theobroma cacao]
MGEAEQNVVGNKENTELQQRNPVKPLGRCITRSGENANLQDLFIFDLESGHLNRMSSVVLMFEGFQQKHYPNSLELYVIWICS